jgi:lipoprotein-anchoring transpeptidase ErfK/SrfK
MRVWVVAVVLGLVIAVAVATATVLAWPQPGLGTSRSALAVVSLPGYAGRVAAVEVRAPDGTAVPVQLQGDQVLPVRRLAVGQALTVEVTVRRPSWAGWLVGRMERRTFTLETPRAHLLGHWLQVRPGAPVTVSFDAPVSRVSIGGAAARSIAPATVVPVGVVASGSHSVGATEVSAAPRSWEKLSAPERVSWFPEQPYLQLLAEPRSGSALAPARPVVLTFSDTVANVLGTRRPVLSPAVPGRWSLLDAHTIAFQPTAALGFGLGASVRVVLPRAAHLAGEAGTTLTRTLTWQVPPGSTLRLQQLLAQLGYLPLDWQPSADAPQLSERSQLVAAVAPPSGNFIWRYGKTPPELHALWLEGRPNQITRGAVMAFEHTHDLAVDAIAGPRVWSALISDAIAGKRRTGGYSYVFVHRNLPQSLNLWHNGRVILTSPGNTGVPAAPTALGTFPVFEHIPAGTMSGTNPDGSHYHDPGVRWISYFHHGEALHAFPRASFGTPQSLGCVELPLAAAAKVWPYTPIGTLVTIEN